jgi:hypothetical protein
MGEKNSQDASHAWSHSKHFSCILPSKPPSACLNIPHSECWAREQSLSEYTYRSALRSRVSPDQPLLGLWQSYGHICSRSPKTGTNIPVSRAATSPAKPCKLQARGFIFSFCVWKEIKVSRSRCHACLRPLSLSHSLVWQVVMGHLLACRCGRVRTDRNWWLPARPDAARSSAKCPFPTTSSQSKICN